MKKLLLVAALAITVIGLAYADIQHERVKLGDLELSSPPGGAEGVCRVQLYNACSGWVWHWSGMLAGDMVGTVYDLPSQCGTYEGGNCELQNAMMVAYYVLPNYGFTVDFEVYNVDGDDCLVGAPVAAMLDVDFPSGPAYWGLGSFGIVPDRHAFTMRWDNGIYPTVFTDNPPSNYGAPYYCAGYVNIPGSYFYADAGVAHCPPVLWNDGTYDVFWYQRGDYYCPFVATEDASWGEVKNLFR
jgi:hypothetical protein